MILPGLPFGLSGKAKIIFVGGTGRITASQSSLALPSGVQAGDFCILLQVTSNTSAPSLVSGFTNGQSGVADGRSGYRWSYKFLGAGETSVPVASDTTNSRCAVVFRNVSQSQPLDVTPPSVVIVTEDFNDPPAITVATAGSAVVALAFGEGTNWASTVGAPSGYQFGAAGGSGSGSSATGTAAAYILGVAAGSINPGIFPDSGGLAAASATIALRPK